AACTIIWSCGAGAGSKASATYAPSRATNCTTSGPASAWIDWPMTTFFYFVQLRIAVQYAWILYLVASGLTLLLGIMGVINLAHGVFYMVGAYIAYAVVQHFASFWLALPIGL